MGHSQTCWRRWLGAAGWTLAIGGSVGFPIYVWQKISSGHGLDTYLTGFGVEFNYIGAAVLIAIMPLVLLAGALLNWWHGRDERDFKRRYGSDSESR